MANIELIYYKKSTQKVDRTEIPFSVTAFTNLNLDAADVTLLGAKIKHSGRKTLVSIPEKTDVGEDASSMIVRLATAIAPKRLRYQAGGTDGRNPRMNQTISVLEALRGGASHISSGMYFSLAATENPLAFDGIRNFLETYLDVENATNDDVSKKQSSKLLQIFEPFATEFLTSTNAGNIICAAFASACTTPSAYVRSSDSDYRWIGVVVNHLNQILLPLVSPDRYSNFFSAKAAKEPFIYRKNSRLPDIILQSSDGQYDKDGIMFLIKEMYQTLAAIDKQKARTVFQLDEAPEYVFEEGDLTYKSYPIDQSTINPPNLKRIVHNMKDVTFDSVTTQNVQDVAENFVGFLEIDPSKTTQSITPGSRKVVSVLPSVRTNSGRLQIEFNAETQTLHTEYFSDSGSDDNIGTGAIKVKCFYEKDTSNTEAELFLKCHNNLISLFSEYCDDAIRLSA